MGNTDAKTIDHAKVVKESREDAIQMEKELKAMLGFEPDCPRCRGWEVLAEEAQIEILGRCGIDTNDSDADDPDDDRNLMEERPGFIRAHNCPEEDSYRLFMYKLPEPQWKAFVEKWKKYIS